MPHSLALEHQSACKYIMCILQSSSNDSTTIHRKSNTSPYRMTSTFPLHAPLPQVKRSSRDFDNTPSNQSLSHSGIPDIDNTTQTFPLHVPPPCQASNRVLTSSTSSELHTPPDADFSNIDSISKHASDISHSPSPLPRTDKVYTENQYGELDTANPETKTLNPFDSAPSPPGPPTPYPKSDNSGARSPSTKSNTTMPPVDSHAFESQFTCDTSENSDEHRSRRVYLENRFGEIGRTDTGLNEDSKGRAPLKERVLGWYSQHCPVISTKLTRDILHSHRHCGTVCRKDHTQQRIA